MQETVCWSVLPLPSVCPRTGLVLACQDVIELRCSQIG